MVNGAGDMDNSIELCQERQAVQLAQGNQWTCINENSSQEELAELFG